MVSIYILNKDTNLKDLLDNNNQLKEDLTTLFGNLLDKIKKRDDEENRSSSTDKKWDMTAKEMLQKILNDKDYDNASKWLFVVQHDKCIGLLRMVHNYDQNLKNAMGGDYVEISNLVINTDKCNDINIFEEMIEHAIKNIINDKNICSNCKVIINVDKDNKKVEAKLKKRGFIRLLVSYPVYHGFNPFKRIRYVRNNLLVRDLLFRNHF
jgi:hypothetical protein